MKTFEVEITYGHESYNGYDHRDGMRKYIVNARNYKSAENKAKKLFKSEFNNCYMILKINFGYNSN